MGISQKRGNGNNQRRQPLPLSNCGNHLGTRPSVRVSAYYLRDTCGSAVKALLDGDPDTACPTTKHPQSARESYPPRPSTTNPFAAAASRSCGRQRSASDVERYCRPPPDAPSTDSTAPSAHSAAPSASEMC